MIKFVVNNFIFGIYIIIMNSVPVYSKKYKLIREKYKFRKHFHTPSLLDELMIKKEKDRYTPRLSCEVKPIKNDAIF